MALRFCHVLFPLLLEAAAAWTVSLSTIARFDGYDRQSDLALAHSAVCAATDAGPRQAPMVLARALGAGPNWIWHADANDIVVAMLDDDTTVLGYARDLQCPDGTISLSTGSQSDADCTTCPAQYKCDGTGVPQLCPPGHY